MSFHDLRPRCPWCGLVSQVIVELNEGGSVDDVRVRCRHCQKQFQVHWDVSISTKVERIQEKELP